MGLHVAQMSSPDEMRRCFDMVTVDNAAILGLQHYGLHEGAMASLVVLDAGDPIEAVRLRPDRLAVISKGKVVSRKDRNDSQLALPRSAPKRPQTPQAARRLTGTLRSSHFAPVIASKAI